VGGFEAIRYKRNLPLRGPSGLAILGGVTALCAYGFYRVGKGNLEKRCVRAFKGSVNGSPFRSAGQKTCQVIC
jgi:NADH dehydrogenase (ubiquinone) 1 alpha subcomplex subunit 13